MGLNIRPHLLTISLLAQSILCACISLVQAALFTMCSRYTDKVQTAIHGQRTTTGKPVLLHTCQPCRLNKSPAGDSGVSIPRLSCQTVNGPPQKRSPRTVHCRIIGPPWDHPQRRKQSPLTVSGPPTCSLWTVNYEVRKHRLETLRHE